ncbi:MAG TPA: ribbon-helix-helix protein, CopG family [Candidatus Nanoarchaeia archaeon]|nr:ribbon-helix-helix protein, CopG family [Candidatus Nanoarchaeia archaeon]
MKRFKQVPVLINIEDIEKLTKLAEIREQPRASLIRQAIKELLRKE